MKGRNVLIIVWMLSFHSFTWSQDRNHVAAYGLLESMLEGKIPLSFKEAVFLVENTFLEGNLSEEKFNLTIDGLVGLTKLVEKNNTLVYDKKDRDVVTKYAAIYSVLTDTQTIILGKDTLFHYPFTYDFDDIFGTLLDIFAKRMIFRGNDAENIS